MSQSTTLARYRSPDEILRVVNRILTPQYDRESIAQSIWLEAWINAGKPDPPESKTIVTVGFIRNRCIDAARSRKRELNAIQDHFSHLDNSYHDPDFNWPMELLEKIISSSSLTNQEKYIIYLRYMKGETIATISTLINRPIQFVSTEIVKIMDQLRRVIRVFNLERPYDHR